MSAFEEMGVCPELIRGVSELGWLLPTPIQAEAVPLILGGGDVLAAAETGSGKTGAFALPMLQLVHEAVRRRGRSAPSGKGGKSQAESLPCVVSAEDRDPVLSVAPDGLKCQSRSEKLWGGARGTLGAYAGRVYYEVTLQDEGLARVGWATTAASLQLGTDKHSWGFGSTGKKSHQRQFDSYEGAGGVTYVMMHRPLCTQGKEGLVYCYTCLQHSVCSASKKRKKLHLRKEGKGSTPREFLSEKGEGSTAVSSCSSPCALPPSGQNPLQSW